MECVWTDYIGSTEDCNECYDGLYLEDELGVGIVLYTIIPNTSDALYNESDFILDGFDTITLILDVDLTTFTIEEWAVSIYLFSDSEQTTVEIGYVLDNVTQDGISFIHTFSTSSGQLGLLERILILGTQGGAGGRVSGIGLANRDVVNFCTPLYFSYSIS